MKVPRDWKLYKHIFNIVHGLKYKKFVVENEDENNKVHELLTKIEKLIKDNSDTAGVSVYHAPRKADKVLCLYFTTNYEDAVKLLEKYNLTELIDLLDQQSLTIWLWMSI